MEAVDLFRIDLEIDNNDMIPLQTQVGLA